MVVITGGVIAANLPDLDLALPRLLDRLGVEHRLDSGVHHRWVTHTPVFWGLVCAGARRVARGPSAPPWAAEVADMIALGAAIHILQDSIANTVALLWPLRRREYGLGLDRLGDVTDHGEYVRRYPASPAAKIEAALMLAALAASGRHLSARRRRGRG